MFIKVVLSWMVSQRKRKIHTDYEHVTHVGFQMLTDAQQMLTLTRPDLTVLSMCDLLSVNRWCLSDWGRV